MAVTVFSDQETIVSGVFASGDSSPIFPAKLDASSERIAATTGIEEYQFSWGSPDAGVNGPLNFRAGANAVFGSAKVIPAININTATADNPTLDTGNAKYVHSLNNSKVVVSGFDGDYAVLNGDFVPIVSGTVPDFLNSDLMSESGLSSAFVSGSIVYISASGLYLWYRNAASDSDRSWVISGVDNLSVWAFIKGSSDPLNVSSGSDWKTVVAAGVGSSVGVGSGGRTSGNTDFVFGLNPNTILSLDGGGEVQVTGGLVFRMTGELDGSGTPYSLFATDTTDCIVVFYGAHFIFDTAQSAQLSMNIFSIASGNNSTPDGNAIIHFYKCSFSYTYRAGNIRMLGGKYLIEGFNFYSGDNIGGLEFGRPPAFTPVGLSLSAPYVSKMANRSLIVGFAGGGVDSANAEWTYVFEGLTASAVAIYNKGKAENDDPDVGVIFVNPTDVPPVPYADSIANLDAAVTARIFLSTKNHNYFDAYSSRNTFLNAQRVRFVFPSGGFNVVVVKTATKGYQQDIDQSLPVFWQNVSRSDSAGALVRFSSLGAEHSGDYFSTDGSPVTAHVDGSGLRNLKVFESARASGKLRVDDTEVYFSLDKDFENKDVSLLLPAWMNALVIDDDQDDEFFCFEYRVIVHHDSYGLRVYNLSFDPASPNYVDLLGSGSDLVLDFDKEEDLLFGSYRDLDSYAIDSLQGFYDAARVFERLRTGNTFYTASHKDAVAEIFSVVDGRMVFTGNLKPLSSGRSVSLAVNGDISFRLSSDFVADNVVAGITTSGNIDLDTFPVLENLDLRAATFTNLPLSIPAGSILDGKVTSSPTAATSYSFDLLSDVSDLELVFGGSFNISIVGKSADDFNTAPVHSGSGSISYVATREVLISADEPTGYYYIRNIGDSVKVAEGKHTSGVQTKVSTSFTGSGTASFRVYFKPLNAGQKIYQTSIRDYNFSSVDAVSVNAIQVADVLVSASLAASIVASCVLTQKSGSAEEGLLTFADADGSSGKPRLNSSETLKVLLGEMDRLVGSHSLYLRILASGHNEEDLIKPSISGSTVDSSKLTFTSGSSQQLLTAVDFVGGGTSVANLSGIAVLAVDVDPPATGLSAAAAQAAVDNSNLGDTLLGIFG